MVGILETTHIQTRAVWWCKEGVSHTQQKKTREKQTKETSSEKNKRISGGNVQFPF